MSKKLLCQSRNFLQKYFVCEMFQKHSKPTEIKQVHISINTSSRCTDIDIDYNCCFQFWYL